MREKSVPVPHFQPQTARGLLWN